MKFIFKVMLAVFVLVSILVGVLFILNLSSVTEMIGPPTTEEIILDAVMSAPTYAFDGRDIQLFKSEKLVDGTVVYTVFFISDFTGYGSKEIRGDFDLVQTIHSVEVTYVDNQIKNMVIDGIWDELDQVYMYTKFIN